MVAPDLDSARDRLLPEDTGGQITLDLDVAMPLLDDLPFESVDTSVEGRIVDATLPAVLGDLDASKANFDVSIMPDRAIIAGQAEFAGVPAQLTWDETFSNGAQPGSRIHGEVPAFGPALLRSLGIDTTTVLDGTAPPASMSS